MEEKGGVRIRRLFHFCESRDCILEGMKTAAALFRGGRLSEVNHYRCGGVGVGLG
jgi:hypothetical protein